MDLIDRFMSKVSPEPNSGCWLWLGSVMNQGYGRISINGIEHLAHRLAYELMRGGIPEGLDLDHLCRVRCCVNPQHLEPVTRKENLYRSPIFNGNRTHCPAGHPYNPENTCYLSRGGRRCRICHRAKVRERKRALRGRM